MYDLKVVKLFLKHSVFWKENGVVFGTVNL
jgi:hypothetical protein